MKLEERLIIAMDFNPKEYSSLQDSLSVREKVIEFSKSFKGRGIYIKVNSILRASGYNLINDIHSLGLKVFADLKLIDIPNTMSTDAQLLSFHKPDMLTVMCCACVDGMSVVQEILPDTKVLGVTVLTSLNTEKCDEIYSCSPEAGVLRFARMAKHAGLRGLILSPQEVAFIKSDSKLNDLEIITPGIRPAWSIVEGDDQSRIMTPAQAIKNGAERIIIGRPIIDAAPNNKGMPQSSDEAVERILKEIQQGLNER